MSYNGSTGLIRHENLKSGFPYLPTNKGVTSLGYIGRCRLRHLVEKDMPLGSLSNSIEENSKKLRTKKAARSGLFRLIQMHLRTVINRPFLLRQQKIRAADTQLVGQ